jgi:hypothetical protein
VRADSVKESNDQVTMKFKANNIIVNSGIFGCCSTTAPFVIMSRQAPDGTTWLKVRETENYPSNLSPTFNPIRISSQELCNTNYHMPLKFDVMSYKDNGEHDHIGSFETTCNSLAYDGKK